MPDCAACRKHDLPDRALGPPPRLHVSDVRFRLRTGLAKRGIPVAGGGKWSKVERIGRPSWDRLQVDMTPLG
ncbi:hypothetical protein KRMM14A1259_64340 [Krasilnikovia sp. MM14-A1259]